MKKFGEYRLKDCDIYPLLSVSWIFKTKSGEASTMPPRFFGIGIYSDCSFGTTCDGEMPKRFLKHFENQFGSENPVM